MAKKRITTPKGRAVYPRLNSPDKKFDEAGVYKIGLAIPSEEAQSLIKQLTQLRDEELAKVKKEKGKAKVKVADLPYTEDEEAGEVVFNFKMKASGTTKAGEAWERRPAIFGADAKPLKDAKVGGGSVCRVSFEPSSFYVPALGVGVSLRLEAVQVLELVEFSGGSAERYGFEAAEELDDDDDDEGTEKEAAEEDTDGDDGSDF